MKLGLTILVLGVLSAGASAEPMSGNAWGRLRKLNLHSPSYLTGEQYRVLYRLDQATTDLTQDQLWNRRPRERKIQNASLKEAAKKMTSEEMTDFLLEYSLTAEGGAIQVF